MMPVNLNLQNFLITLLLFSLTEWSISGQSTVIPQQIHQLVRGKRETVNCFSENNNYRVPSIYCYKGDEKRLASIWESASIAVKLDNDLFESFEGSSSEEIMEKFRLHESSWSANIFSLWKRKSIQLNPFNKTCVGILTSKSYSVTLIVKDVDQTLAFTFMLGFILFMYAENLSKNHIFYYSCGITIGILCSVIILLYLISRIFPSKPFIYGISLGGVTMSYYFIYYVLDNAKMIALQYQRYVIGYILASALISFSFCYRFGPFTDPRTKNLIGWFLQGLGLFFVFYSSYLYEVTYFICLVLVLYRMLPFKLLFTILQSVKRKLFRPKIRHISKKEYLEQGQKETKKALDDLRGYCSSPDCNAWKTVLKLKNPSKFAEFVEGSSHLSDDEIDDYRSLVIKPNGSIISDDSDSVGDFSESD